MMMKYFGVSLGFQWKNLQTENCSILLTRTGTPPRCHYTHDSYRCFTAQIECSLLISNFNQIYC